jgi:peptidyl-prolyl cis-trans isomerase C
MKIKIVQNPITHIILFGFFLAIVLLISFGIPTNKEDNRRIVITNTDVQQLWVAFKRTWQRDPTPTELRGQIQNFVREEVLYREALNRDYDRDDIIIKRSLVRKMDFLAEGQVQAKNITEDEIKAYYNLRRERYRIPPRISFSHIYFNLDQRGKQAENDVKQTIDKLKNLTPETADLADFGDRFMLKYRYTDQTPRDIQSQFGEEFSSQLIGLEPGKWHGPIVSGYGLHAVYLENRVESRIPDWTEVSDQILNDLLLEEKTAAKEQFYTEILRQYQVVFEQLPEEILSGESVDES